MATVTETVVTPQAFVVWTTVVVKAPAIFGVVACLAGLHILANIIYNLCFHPYAKYPGPFLAKITELYAAYHAWRGDIHIDMWRCHQKYGEKVRYAPNRLNVNTVSALRSKSLPKPIFNPASHSTSTKTSPQVYTPRANRTQRARTMRPCFTKQPTPSRFLTGRTMGVGVG